MHEFPRPLLLEKRKSFIYNKKSICVLSTWKNKKLKLQNKKQPVNMTRVGTIETQDDGYHY